MVSGRQLAAAALRRRRPRKGVPYLIAFQDGTRPFVGCCESPRFCCPQLVSRRTRLVIANVPNNPTGWLPSHDEWLRCAARRLGRCRAASRSSDWAGAVPSGECCDTPCSLLPMAAIRRRRELMRCLRGTHARIYTHQRTRARGWREGGGDAHAHGNIRRGRIVDACRASATHLFADEMYRGLERTDTDTLRAACDM